VSTAASPSRSLGVAPGEAPAGVPATVVAALLGRAAATPDAVALHVYDAASGGVRPALTWRAWADEARAFAAALVGGGRAAGRRGGRARRQPAVLAGRRPGRADGRRRGRGRLPDGARRAAPRRARRLRRARARRRHGRAVGEGAGGRGGPAAQVAWCAPTRRPARPWRGTRGSRPAARRSPVAAGAEVDRRVAALRPEDVAALVYTSGSTGEPKGACIPHAALVASGASVRDALGLTAADTALSFLPYAHSAERVFGQATRLVCGMEAALVPDPADVWAAARAYAPTLFGGLPRYYEKAHDALLAAERDGAGRRARRVGGDVGVRRGAVAAAARGPAGARGARRRVGGRAGARAPRARRAVRRARAARHVGRRAAAGRGGRAARRGRAHRVGRVRADRAPVRRHAPPGRLRLQDRGPADARHRAARGRRRRAARAPLRAHLRRLPRPPRRHARGLHPRRRVAPHRRPGRGRRRRAGARHRAAARDAGAVDRQEGGAAPHRGAARRAPAGRARAGGGRGAAVRGGAPLPRRCGRRARRLERGADGAADDLARTSPR
jgi:hypothetical protein